MTSVLFVRSSLGASRGGDSVKKPYRVAQSLLDDTLLSHLGQSRDIDVDELCLDLQPYFPQGSLTTAANARRGQRATFAVNLPFIREIMLLVTVFCASLTWAWRERRKHRVVFLMTNFAPAAMGINLASRLLRFPRVVTLTDLSGFSFSAERVAEAPWWKRPWLNAYVERVRDLERSYDGYVLLTEQMGGLVNLGGRPQVVVEGVLNTSDLQLSDVSPSGPPFVVAHAGTLDRLYGVELILDSFAHVADQAAELWLFGTGDMDAEIARRASRDGRIKFHGFQPRGVVFAALQQATLLVNLRDPKDDYTKYSFPSKLLEYMASGTPVLTTSLSGIPAEYKDHVYLVESIDAPTIAGALTELSALPPSARLEKGQAARDFVLSRKTARSQCPRVEDLIVAVARLGGRHG